MPVCPQCHAVPGERHTYRDNGQPCVAAGRVNPATKEDLSPVTVEA